MPIVLIPALAAAVGGVLGLGSIGTFLAGLQLTYGRKQPLRKRFKFVITTGNEGSDLGYLMALVFRNTNRLQLLGGTLEVTSEEERQLELLLAPVLKILALGQFGLLEHVAMQLEDMLGRLDAAYYVPSKAA